MDEKLISLPSEMRFLVFKYCSKKDWLKISLCCKVLHQDVKPLLWRELTLPWCYLNAPIHTMIKCVKYTSEVTFEGYPFNNSKDLTIVENFRSLVAGLNARVVTSLIINCYIPPGGLKSLAQCAPNIQYLRLSNLESGGTGWNHIPKFKCLKRLSMSTCDVEDGHFEDMGDLSNLEELTVISCSKLTENCFKSFSKAPKLNLLCFVANSSIWYEKPIEKCGYLQKLRLNCSVGSNFFSSAEQNLNKLQVLTIDDAPIDDTAVFCIAKIACLKELSFGDCHHITNESMLYVSNMVFLEKLAVQECNNVTDWGLRHISRMESLEELDLSLSDSFTDNGLSYLSGATALRRLVIDSCYSFTNQGLEHISKIQTLEALSIEYGEFTDEGLHHLTSLSKLKEFAFGEGNITKDAVQRAGLPDFFRW